MPRYATGLNYFSQSEDGCVERAVYSRVGAYFKKHWWWGGCLFESGMLRIVISFGHLFCPLIVFISIYCGKTSPDTGEKKHNKLTSFF